MTGSEAVPRVNWRPRGGWPELTSKQCPSNKRCSNSYSAATIFSTCKHTRVQPNNVCFVQLNITVLGLCRHTLLMVPKQTQSLQGSKTRQNKSTNGRIQRGKWGSNGSQRYNTGYHKNKAEQIIEE